MHATVTITMKYRRAARGFTLIELMIVLVIAAILITVGAPALGEFVADQRVRTVTSDIAGEIAFARAKAIEHSRRVFIEKTGVTWSNGWRIFVDLDNSLTFTAGDEVLKVFDGFTPSNLYVCSTVVDFANELIFRPDGRVSRPDGAVITPNDGLYVVDTMGDGVQANNKIRGLLFGVSGRATVVRLNGAVPLC